MQHNLVIGDRGALGQPALRHGVVAAVAGSPPRHPQRRVERVAHVELRSEGGVALLSNTSTQRRREVVRPDRDHVGRQLDKGRVARPGWTASL